MIAFFFYAAFWCFWLLTIICVVGAVVSFVQMLKSRAPQRDEDYSLVPFYMFRDFYLTRTGRMYRARLVGFLSGFAFALAAGFTIAYWRLLVLAQQ